jgi:hypothetical protein
MNPETEAWRAGLALRRWKHRTAERQAGSFRPKDRDNLLGKETSEG